MSFLLFHLHMKKDKNFSLSIVSSLMIVTPPKKRGYHYQRSLPTPTGPYSLYEYKKRAGGKCSLAPFF